MNKEPVPHLHLKRYGFKNLLVWLLVYQIVGPFLERMPFAHTALMLFLSLVLFSAIYTIKHNARLMTAAILLLVLILIPMWLDKFGVLTMPAALLPALIAVYLGLLVVSFLRHLMAVRKVDTNVICASLCTYLFLGLLWGSLFLMLEELVPGSFVGEILESASGRHEMAHAFNYFSFVTISTLGYGDITPTTQSATALCQSEAVLGQFFIVVLVARLVAIQVAQEGK